RHNLSIKRGNLGRVLIHCHHEPSCAPADIMKALGMTLADLYPREPGRSHPSGNSKPNKPTRTACPSPEIALAHVIQRHGKPSGSWTYLNADGSEAFRVYRFDFQDPQSGEPRKDYRPVHPTTAGWVLGDPPGPLPLYYLPELTGASRIYVTEGEK